MCVLVKIINIWHQASNVVVVVVVLVVVWCCGCGLGMYPVGKVENNVLTSESSIAFP